jgi:hypothetical protein
MDSHNAGDNRNVGLDQVAADEQPAPAPAATAALVGRSTASARR